MSTFGAAFFTFWFFSMAVFEGVYRFRKDKRFKEGYSYKGKVGINKWIKAAIWSIPVGLIGGVISLFGVLG